MNHPPPSDRTYVTGAPASPEFCILTSGFSPNMRNKPNLPSRHHPVGFTVSKECETNPIYRTAGVSPASPAPNIRNEPNPAPILHGVPLQRRIGAGNEPNCHPRVASRAPGCGAKRSGPKSRDLFNHHRQRRFQTNKPTPTTQKMRNEPNPGTRSVPPPPISTKRTQFHPQRTCGRPKNMKRTQFTAPPPPRDPNIRNEPNFSHGGLVEEQKMRNEPNLPYRPVPLASRRLFHPQKCETNPISSCGQPQLCETNPISGQPDERLKTIDWRLKTAFNKTNPIPNHQYTFYNLQYTIPWPKSTQLLTQQALTSIRPDNMPKYPNQIPSTLLYVLFYLYMPRKYLSNSPSSIGLSQNIY